MRGSKVPGRQYCCELLLKVKMLKETETEKTLGFFFTFLSLVTFQLRVPASWLRLWMITPTNHVISREPKHFGDFRNIFVLNIGEDKKKILPSEREPPGTELNPALVIALRS